jgi:hypothetical protein
MRFSKIIWKISPALLGMAALILIAGAAAGQENGFFNNEALINPEDKYQGSGGYVDGEGEEYESGVWARCASPQIEYRIGCDTWHPDKVNISTHQGQVDQKKKNNNAQAWMIFTRRLGENQDPEELDLDCDKVQLKGKYNTKNEKIDAKCTIKNCGLPGNLTVEEIQDAIDCAEAAVDNEELGKRAGNLKLKGDQLSGHIRSKGTPVEEGP